MGPNFRKGQKKKQFFFKFLKNMLNRPPKKEKFS
jgi:hypothetical protein